MALRKVNGAGNKDLFVQLTVELLIVQFIALVAGLFFIEICMSRFLEFTRIAPNSYYGEILVYLFIVFIAGIMPIVIGSSTASGISSQWFISAYIIGPVGIIGK